MVSQVPQQEGRAASELRTPATAAGFGLPPETTEAIAVVARELGAEVYHAELVGRELRVQVECPSGATVRTCSAVSRALASHLDAVGFLHRQYSLEVSTPGVERRLYRPQDYARALSRRVLVLTRGGWLEGRLEAIGSAGITLRSESKEPKRGEVEPASHEVAYADIREARIRVSDAELFGRTGVDRNATKGRKARA